MTSAPAPLAALTERWQTPRILKSCRTVLLALDLLLLLAVIGAAGVHRRAMQLVGRDTAPSIIAAQHIKAALADMDADLATELVVPTGMAGPSPGAFDARRVEADQALIEAAKNITYGKAEEVPIQGLQLSIGTYDRLAQEARDLEDAGQADMSTRYYRAAAIVMDGTVLPYADDLDKANNDQLELQYDQQTRESLLARLGVGLVGLVVLAALVWVQGFLSRRTRRTLNPALLAATVLTFGLTLYGFAEMSVEARQLHIARYDAFSSIHALWRALAVGYEARSSETRDLLDPLHAGEYEAEFRARTQMLAEPPAGMSGEQLVRAESSGHAVAGFTGDLADELNNITFPGEREAALRSLEAFEHYLAIDEDVRALEGAGKHQEAIVKSIGREEGQANGAFQQFASALGQTLDINQKEFDRAVDAGFSALGGMEWKATIFAALIAVLIVVGFAPRIREYE